MCRYQTVTKLHAGAYLHLINNNNNNNNNIYSTAIGLEPGGRGL
jgi:hypothetical protein